ncbi:putative NAD(+) ADP-ribosyltransferase [Helianthus annuus]|nr:putative NAD(+) ADP-ribosyltransferase [Helianthus annuus]
MHYFQNTHGLIFVVDSNDRDRVVEGDDINDATLNQTNVGDNNNRFYIIQALGYFPIYISEENMSPKLCTNCIIYVTELLAESNNGSAYMVYNTWVRVGVKGQDKLHGPYTSVQSALDEFEQKFYTKTKNYWLDRKDFVSHPKWYTLLEMDYNEAGKETAILLETR